MFNWGQFWQAVSPGLTLMLVGGAIAMFTRLQDYGGRIVQLEKDTSANGAKIDLQHERMHTIEITMARVDENVKEILRVQASAGRRSGDKVA